jgi:hypothetical protein
MILSMVHMVVENPAKIFEIDLDRSIHLIIMPGAR